MQARNTIALHDWHVITSIVVRQRALDKEEPVIISPFCKSHMLLLRKTAEY